MTKWCLCGLAESVHLSLPLPVSSPPRWLMAQRPSSPLEGIAASNHSHYLPPAPPTAKGVILPAEVPATQAGESFPQNSWWPMYFSLSVCGSTSRTCPHPKRYFSLPFRASSLSRAGCPLLQDQRVSTPKLYSNYCCVHILTQIVNSLLLYYCHIWSRKIVRGKVVVAPVRTTHLSFKAVFLKV